MKLQITAFVGVSVLLVLISFINAVTANDKYTIVDAPVIKVGYSYTFEVENSSGSKLSYVATREITAIDGNRMTVVTTNVKSGSKRISYYTPTWDYLGSGTDDNNGVSFSPALKYLDFPLSVGKKWTAQSVETNKKSGHQRQYTINGIVEGWEKVQVPAGEFEALKIVLKTEVKDGNKVSPGTDVSWYVPTLCRTVKSELTGKDISSGIEEKKIIRLLFYHVSIMDITEQKLKKTSGPELIPILKSKSFSKENSDSKIDYDAQLIQAAQEGNLANVQSALTNGADINATGIANYDGEKVATKALIVASSNGHSEIVKLLLGKGADVDVKTTKTGATALICASNRGDTEVVKLLLNKGADINVKTTNDGWTALIYASYNGDTEVVKLLLDKGADVNVKNITGKTALTYAYSRGDTEVVKLLSSKDTAISTVVASEPRTFASANNPGYSKYPGECMIQCEKENLPLGCSSNIASCVNCLNEFENKYTACLMNNCGISKEDTAFRKFYEPGQVCR